MALPEKEEIVPELLHLFVVGPGTGETVLLLIPPERWLIVDSFKCGRASRPAAESIVSRYGGKVAILALTHPHQDHYPGFVDLIDRFSDAVLGCVHPREREFSDSLTVDPVSALSRRPGPRTREFGTNGRWTGLGVGIPFAVSLVLWATPL